MSLLLCKPRIFQSSFSVRNGCTIWEGLRDKHRTACLHAHRGCNHSTYSWFWHEWQRSTLLLNEKEGSVYPCCCRQGSSAIVNSSLVSSTDWWERVRTPVFFHDNPAGKKKKIDIPSRQFMFCLGENPSETFWQALLLQPAGPCLPDEVWAREFTFELKGLRAWTGIVFCSLPFLQLSTSCRLLDHLAWNQGPTLSRTPRHLQIPSTVCEQGQVIFIVWSKLPQRMQVPCSGIQMRAYFLRVGSSCVGKSATSKTIFIVATTQGSWPEYKKGPVCIFWTELSESLRKPWTGFSLKLMFVFAALSVQQQDQENLVTFETTFPDFILFWSFFFLASHIDVTQPQVSCCPPRKN